jgi:hypothetical protein
MSFFSSLLSKIKGQQPSDPKKIFSIQLLHSITLYYKELVQNQAVSLEIDKKINEFNILSQEEKQKKYIRFYFSIEELITKTGTSSKEILRENVRKKIPLENAEKEFTVIFLPEEEQGFFLFDIATKPFVKYLKNNFGLAGLKKVVSTATAGTSFEIIRVTENGLDFQPVIHELNQYHHETLLENYHNLFRSLAHELSLSVGEVKTQEMIISLYFFIKNNYDDEIIKRFLLNLPAEILSDERQKYYQKK